ncbi:YlxQ-related RNA-binding protein [Ligilactobacillus sp. WILCCON 0076]|uniref:YlxQ-related RNA-binding protein n=1 Tax=Ligilactobacillus ubinensis TaxID=2876789 RepID=A0A9X2FJP6_9LACO|nr:YlxQ-related RNA-binding protein [Ligilactobacillus ubinensis]MCP0886026.1 YlxQ-related RNA-binding protein [Ligilactobacillus ubinensis]
MENKQRILNLLGLARRASKIVTGEDMVLKQIRSQKVFLVFVANDAGPNTRKKFTDKCHSYNVTFSDVFTQAELSVAIGQKRSIVAVCDTGFSKKMRQLLSN